MRTGMLVALLIVVAGLALWLRRPPSPPPVPAREPAAAPLRHARIEDEARILAPFGSKLAAMTDELDSALGIDVHVVTSDAPATGIEAQAERLFRDRHVGRGARTGGILVLLNRRLGRARIEVGYSLEAGLPDLRMGRLARDQLAPYATHGFAGMAVMDVLHQLGDLVRVAALRGELALDEQYRRSSSYRELEKFLSGGAGANARLLALSADADPKRPVPQETRSRYAPATSIEGSVDAFLRATADLAGDPSLELFTDGSRLLRASYPLAPLEELQRHARITASMPLESIVEGDRAVVTSRRPATGFVPILLQRIDGTWRVDLVETWKNLFFDSSGNYYLRNRNTPYAFGLRQFGEGRHFAIDPVPLDGQSIEAALAALRSRHDALSALRRGELWFRNCFVYAQAFAAYDEALSLAPRDPLILETIGRRALYLGLPEAALPALARLGAGGELLLAEAHAGVGDTARAMTAVRRALAENPQDLYALAWKLQIEEQAGRQDDAHDTKRLLDSLANDPERKAAQVTLWFHPREPIFDADTTIDVGGTTVHDHSRFGVQMVNPGGRAVVIERVDLASRGNGAASGLGNIVDYWRFPSGGRRLGPGESVYFEKPWGFTTDTSHLHVRYLFRVCWRGEGTTLRQCRTQRVDALPRPLR